MSVARANSSPFTAVSEVETAFYNGLLKERYKVGVGG